MAKNRTVRKMTPEEEAVMETVLFARGWRIVGSVSPDVNGGTEAECDLLFVGDVAGVLRNVRRLPDERPE